MKDTSPDLDATFTAMFGALSESERLRMTCRMFDEAKTLAAVNIRATDPGISPVDLRIKLFQRLYHGDFTPEELARIVSALGEAGAAIPTALESIS